MDLVKRMVELSGLSVRDEVDSEGDIEIQITGLRPGEKLFEELLIGDNPEPTSHPRIMRAREAFVPWDQISDELGKLNQSLKANDIDQVRQQLQQLVSGYKPSDGIADWVYLEQMPQKNETWS
jgi:FlaA1/EpsC-like NDP-sugar epimerase